jgi:hypothetical protein
VARVTGRNENRSQKADEFTRAGRYAGVHKTRLECAPVCIRLAVAGALPLTSKTRIKEIHLSTIPRRTFIQLSAVAAVGCLAQPGREARADDLPRVSEDDPMAQAMKYTDDASTVDAGSRTNPAADQNCANCALIQGADGEAWRPCQIFPGKSVAAAGWCSVWAPKG